MTKKQTIDQRQALSSALYRPAHGGMPGCSVEWVIRHPGRNERITVKTFKEAIDEYFEGFNPPVKIINGRPEDFSNSHKRVKDYLFPHGSNKKPAAKESMTSV